MKFSLVTLYVKDLEKSLHFYNVLLEMPIIRRLPGPGGTEMVFLGEADAVNLELIPGNPPEAYTGFSIGLDVENLAAVKARLLENGYPVKEEMAVNPHTTLCFLDGPSGETVELIEYR